MVWASFKQYGTAWLARSIQKHFRDNTDSNIPLYLEGAMQGKDQDATSYQLRLDGPEYMEHTQNDLQIIIDVNILITMVESPTDINLMDTLIGDVSRGFQEIPVYKYGAGPQDTKEHVGCLHLLQPTFIVNRFGRVTTSVNLLQSSVEGRFETYLKGTF